MKYLIILLISLTSLRCAFYENWRGMHHSWGTQVNRIMYGAFIGSELELLAAIWHLPLWIGSLCTVLAFLAAIIGNSVESQDTIYSHEGMSMLMTLILAIILSPLIYFVHYLVYFVAFGILGGFSYWLGYRMKISLTLFGINFCKPGDVSWGETFNGYSTIGWPLTIIGFIGMVKYWL